MLAGHVETELLRHFDVIFKSVIRRRGVDTIRPEALIERTHLKDRLVVEHQAGDTFVVFAKGNFSHGEVAGKLVIIEPQIQYI